MTMLTSKLQDVTKRLHHLTVWRPNDHDPFFELDRWRSDAHTTIEQIYTKKRQQIEQLTEKHEREFMRQIARQRSLLNSIRQRFSSQKELLKQNESSISNDLKRIENDINTKLGRGEIAIETIPLNLDDSVMVSLRTYLSATPAMYHKEISARHQVQKSVRKSTDEVTRAYEEWRQIKNEQLKTANDEFRSAKQQREEYYQKDRMRKLIDSEKAYNAWMHRKEARRVVIKKKMNNDDDIKQETNLT